MRGCPVAEALLPEAWQRSLCMKPRASVQLYQTLLAEHFCSSVHGGAGKQTGQMGLILMVCEVITYSICALQAGSAKAAPGELGDCCLQAPGLTVH